MHYTSNSTANLLIDPFAVNPNKKGSSNPLKSCIDPSITNVLRVIDGRR